MIYNKIIIEYNFKLLALGAGGPKFESWYLDERESSSYEKK